METTLGSLRVGEVEAYRRDGFIFREGVLDHGQVEAVKAALSRLVALYGPDRERAEVVGGAGRQIAAGTQIRRRDGPFFFQLEQGQEPALDDPAKLELQVRKFMSFEDEDPVFREILAPGGPVLSVVRDLVADEPLLYQAQALIKPPRIGATKPWHQDNAYFSVAPLESVCGVWVAIDEATVRNGCMHMLKAGHRFGALRHVHKRDCEIDVRDLDLSTLEAVPLKPGGALFFSGMVPHETPPNRSDRRRRALQFHFRGSRSTILPGPDYDEIFKDSGGRPASCAAIRREGA